MMDFTNINDPAGVKALLEQLRSSQAWQELSTNLATNPNSSLAKEEPSRPNNVLEKEPVPSVLSPVGSEVDQGESSLVSNHISSLLSKLQPGNASPLQTSPHTYSYKHINHESPEECLPPVAMEFDCAKATVPPPTRSSSQPKSVKSVTFNQALPVIAQLASNPDFLQKLQKMHEEQEQLEKKLWEERNQILRSQEEKVKVAQAKAAITGAGISQSEAKALEGLFLKELKTFDEERALPAWDVLITKQQSTLEMLGIPCMHVTSTKTDREKQQRIIQVLDGLLEAEDEEMEL